MTGPGSEGAWTGAVGEKKFAEAPTDWAKALVQDILSQEKTPSPNSLEAIKLLLYAEDEWGDRKAGDAGRAALKTLPQADLIPRPETFLAIASQLLAPEAKPQSVSEAGVRISALCDLFQLTAEPKFRAAADTLAQWLFQELWDRERGGFLAKPPQNGASAAPIVLEDNAAAFEAIWRLHHITGNPSYRRWLAWGIKGLAADCRGQSAAKQAGLARVSDMVVRGRLYLEMVGRPEDEKSRALVMAAFSRYCPRRIVSWISPDDRDYVMAHRLEAPGYPALFACVELKPVGFAQKPEDVPELFKRLQPAAR